MTKNKYLLFFAVAFIIILASAGFAQALEVTYPNIPLPGLKTITKDSTLPELVAYYFGLLIYIAGAISLISFVIGAVGLINPNIEAHGDAKDRMKGAVLGLVLTLASFIIIKTINPALTDLTLTPLPGTTGVFYYNGTDKKPVSDNVSDNLTRPSGYDQLIYCCEPDCSGGTGPALLIWEFPKQSLEGGNNLSDPSVHVVRKTCDNNVEPIGNLGSFKWEYESTGIYYCLGGCNGDNMCSGYMSSAHTTSEQYSIDFIFRWKTGGVRIVNDAAKGLYYGVIFHQMMGLENGGPCNEPIINTEDGAKCRTVAKPDYTSANDIFLVNREPGASGNGIEFYSEPHGWDADQKAGFEKELDEDIPLPTGGIAWSLAPEQICFDYTKVNRPDSYMYKCSTEERPCGKPLSEDSGHGCSSSACESFQDCPGSIRIKGSYLVGLYSEIGSDNTGGMMNLGNSLYCQTFRGDVENLGARPFLGPGMAKTDFNNVYIIPIK